MTTAAKSMLLTLRTALWLDATRSTNMAGESTMRELRGLGLVKYHHPMNAWFITDAGKLAANKLQSQLERETA